MNEYIPRSYGSIAYAKKRGKQICMRDHILIYRVITLDMIYLVVGNEIQDFKKWIEKREIPVNWQKDSSVHLVHAATLSGLYNCEVCGEEKCAMPGICADCSTPLKEEKSK